MRLYITLTSATQIVPFNYQPQMVGAIHKWLGRNEQHGNLSLYSFSSLSQAKGNSTGLIFDKGSRFFINFHDESLAKKLIAGIREDSEFCFGMRVTDIQIEENPDFKTVQRFHPGSPILIKRTIENNIEKQYTFNDAESAELMRETLLRKMEMAGLEPDETLKINFDLTWQQKKTKLIHYRDKGNKANLCPVIIQAKPETKLFAWNVGIGNSTGIGFGAII